MYIHSIYPNYCICLLDILLIVELARYCFADATRSLCSHLLDELVKCRFRKTPSMHKSLSRFYLSHDRASQLTLVFITILRSAAFSSPFPWRNTASVQSSLIDQSSPLPHYFDNSTVIFTFSPSLYFVLMLLVSNAVF